MAKLTEKQRSLLDEYLLEKHELILKTNPTAAEVASWASDYLKTRLDLGNITHRVGNNGVLYRHKWPGTDQSIKGRLTDKLMSNITVHQIELLRNDIARLASELGLFGYGRKVTEWMSVLNQAKCDLADTDQREPEER